MLTVEPRPGRRYGVPLLDEPGQHPALVRLSRSLGLPPGWPDISGLAVRLPDVHGAGSSQDLLFIGSGGPPLLRQLIVLARGRPRWYSTISVYDLAGRRRLLGARVLPGAGAVEEGIAVDIWAATRTGAWERLGTLRTDERLAPAESERLAFDVTRNTGGALTPYGPVHALRHRSYRQAQLVRGVRPGDQVPGHEGSALGSPAGLGPGEAAAAERAEGPHRV